MNLTMEMLQVITMKKTPGAIPDGLKVTTITGPDSLQPLPASPVLAVGGYTLWPMSYIDNRVSFGIVMYDLNWKPINTFEKTGARYIFNITLAGQGSSGTVTFWGQANQQVQLTLAEISAML
jgi:hypothetical protein